MDLERIKQNFRIRSGRSQKKQKQKPQPAELSEKKAASKPYPTANGVMKSPLKRESEQQIQSPVTESHASTSESTQITETDASSLPQKHEEMPNVPTEHVDLTQSSNSGTAEERPELPRAATTEVPTKKATMDKEETNIEEEQRPKPSRRETEPNHHTATASSETDDFDLQPPKPKAKPPSLETIAELLWSSGHLDSLLHYPPQLARFSAFLQRYSSENYPFLAQYLETQKAIKAVEYANAIAEGLAPKDTNEEDLSLSKQRAAQLDSEFEKISDASFKALVHDALPAYINYLLIKIVSECLTNEITGRSTPVMRDLVGGLSEVFCLTDPTREDNPIIYASEEFYRLTRYGPEDVINNNCRFLQGKKTHPESPKRLKTAIEGGKEITETLLNYRRDGRPFINMLMIAPLHDKNGKLKYHIGAQIDVSGLVEGGRALQGFQRYLNRRADDAKKAEVESRRQPLNDVQIRKKNVLAKLRDLSESFDLEESAIVQAHSRSNSLDREDDDNRSVGSVDRAPRRYYADSDDSDPDDNDDRTDEEQASKWKLGDSGGKLPGVYDSFMLLKPAPSLRIVFVSPKLRQFKQVLQTAFMSHVSAPAATLTGLNESLKEGIPVSAKIHFSTERGTNRDGNVLRSGHKHEDGKNGFAIWVSCTPLLDEDDRIGVWMCVIVEKSKVGAVKRREQAAEQEGQPRGRTSSIEQTSENLMKSPTGEDKEKPIKPVRVGSKTRIDTARKHVLEKASKRTQDQKLKERESVYFDTEPNHGSEADESSSPSDPYRLNGLPEKESVTPDENLNQVEVHSLTHGPQAVTPVTPERPYEQPTRSMKPFSARIPGLERLPYYDLSDDEIVSVQSPQAQQTSPRQNERVLIEEDSDFVSVDESSPIAEDDLNHNRENIDVGSPYLAHQTPVGPEAEINDYQLGHEIPPSVPSSAYLPDDEDEEDLDYETKQIDRDEFDETGSSDDKETQEPAKHENKESEPELSSDSDLPEDKEKHRDAEQSEDLAKSEETLRATLDEDDKSQGDNTTSRPRSARKDLSYSPPYNRARDDTDGDESELNIDNSNSQHESTTEKSEQEEVESPITLPHSADPTKTDASIQAESDVDESQSVPQIEMDKSEQPIEPSETDIESENTSAQKELQSVGMKVEETISDKDKLDEQKTGTLSEEQDSALLPVEDKKDLPESEPNEKSTASDSEEGSKFVAKKESDTTAGEETESSSDLSVPSAQKADVAVCTQKASSESSDDEEQQHRLTSNQKVDDSIGTVPESKPNSDIEKLEDKFHSLGSDLQNLATSPPASTVQHGGDEHLEQDRDDGKEEEFGLKTPTTAQSDQEDSAELPITRGSSSTEGETSKPDKDKDSAISINSPARRRRILISDSPEPPESPPLSPARQNAEVEPDLKHDRPLPRHADVENWVEDARPASSHDASRSRMPIDYLQAGSARWSNARRPKLTVGMLEQANKGAHIGHGDGDDDTDDPCIRSPYSVD